MGSRATSRRERRSFKKELGEECVTKQKMKRDIKELELEEVRPITGLSVFFKDAWDRWQLQTISHHRAASSLEEIRDSSSPPFTHAPHFPYAHRAPFPPILGFSQADRFDVAQCAGSCRPQGCRSAAGPLGHQTTGIRLERSSISGALRCLALSGLIKALRQG